MNRLLELDDGEVAFVAGGATGHTFVDVATDEAGSRVVHSLDREDQRRLLWWLLRRTLVLVWPARWRL